MTQYTVSINDGIVEYKERKYKITGHQLDMFYSLLLQKQRELESKDSVTSPTYLRNAISEMIAEIKISAENPT